MIDDRFFRSHVLLRVHGWSLPLDREFGLDASMLNRLTPDAMAALRSRLLKKIEGTPSNINWEKYQNDWKGDDEEKGEGS